MKTSFIRRLNAASKLLSCLPVGRSHQMNWTGPLKSRVSLTKFHAGCVRSAPGDCGGNWCYESGCSRTIGNALERRDRGPSQRGLKTTPVLHRSCRLRSLKAPILTSDPLTFPRMPSMIFPFGRLQTIRSILLAQQVDGPLWNQSAHPLEGVFLKRPDLARIVSMVVLAGPDAWLLVGMRLCDRRDVDEKTIPRIDPSSVDHIHCISPVSLDGMWADVQQIITIYPLPEPPQTADTVARSPVVAVYRAVQVTLHQ